MILDECWPGINRDGVALKREFINLKVNDFWAARINHFIEHWKSQVKPRLIVSAQDTGQGGRSEPTIFY